ncbi:ATP-binding protein, partial [Kitasatospora sp. NPDC001095]
MTLLSNVARGNAALPPPEPATICLPYLPESVGVARRFVSGKLREWGLDDLVDDASVVVSELATNALKTGCQTRMVIQCHEVKDWAAVSRVREIREVPLLFRGSTKIFL